MKLKIDCLLICFPLKKKGCLWLSGITGSIAYNWSQPGMKTSVKIIHARYYVRNIYLFSLSSNICFVDLGVDYGIRVLFSLNFMVKVSVCMPVLVLELWS